VEITQTAKRSPERGAVRVNATSAERFRFALARGPAVAPSTSQGAQPFHWPTPEGWQELPPTEFRIANFRVGENLDGECYVSLLPGGAGGVFANANRWRGQMGLEPYTEGEFDALPTATVINQIAKLVEFDGVYSGMGQGAPKKGYRLKGALLEYEGASVFIKMVGPAEVVEEESERFDIFIQGIHPPAGGHVHDTEVASSSSSGQTASNALPAGHPPIGAETMAVARNSTGEGDFTWTAPDGWRQAPARSMRLATFTFGPQDEGECYVSILGPGAGGMVMNLNRWRGQFGLSPLSEEEIDALPKVDMLGEPVPLLEAAGDFVGMGGVKQTGQALFGAARFLEDKSVFIKMTGPEDLVRSEKGKFVDFCSSLQAQ